MFCLQNNEWKNSKIAKKWDFLSDFQTVWVVLKTHLSKQYISDLSPALYSYPADSPVLFESFFSRLVRKAKRTFFCVG